MTESATTGRAAKRLATSDAISRAARVLADEAGLDGFTMDQLAEAAGVSRRTLFNYFPGKLDAVLGEREMPDPGLLQTFMSGGPHGDLLADLRVLVHVLMSSRPMDRDEITRMHRLIRDEPRIVHAAHQRMVGGLDELASVIVDREGPGFDPATARLLIRIMGAIFDESIEAFAADPDGPTLADHFDAGCDRFASLVR